MRLQNRICYYLAVGLVGVVAVGWAADEVKAKWRALLALLLLTACISKDTRPAQPRATQAQYEAAVAVESACVFGDPFTSDRDFVIRGGTGSGVVVDSHHILTALHVVDCPFIQGVRVQFANGETRRALVAKWDRDADLALLVTYSAESWPVNIAPAQYTAPEYGEAACVATAAPYRGWSCGHISSVATHRMVLGAVAVSGNSGSGVYDSAGRLVGILVSVAIDDPAYAAATLITTAVMP
jgi:S1-C subfamily serine protease